MIEPTPTARLPELAAAIRDAELVALDTEFHAERRYLPRLYLLQLCLPDGAVYLVDPLEEGALEQLAEPLRNTPWLVHAGRQDLRILAPLLGGVPSVVYDTQIAAGLAAAAYPAPYGDLAHHWCGVSVDKSSTLSDWSRRPLRTEQLSYAAEDVRHLGALWARLSARLRELDRWETALQAFSQLRAEALQPSCPQTAWRAIAAAQVLDDDGLRVLAAMAAWREQSAIDADQPVRSVLSDGLLMDLARRRPKSINRILGNRRFPKKLAQRLGGELIALMEQALASEVAPPRVVRPQTDTGRLAAALALFLEVHGAEHSWSRRLVAPDRWIEDLSLAVAAGEAHPEMDPWREALAGPAVANALTGRTQLQILAARAALREPCAGDQGP